MTRNSPRPALTWLLLPLLGACADTSASADPVPVTVSLAVAEGAPVARGVQGPADRANSISVAGANGTLVLEELNLIVGPVKLADEDGDRVDMEPGARLVDVPMDEVPVQVANRLVPVGGYTALLLAVRSLELPDPAGSSEPRTAGVPVRERFPSWPGEAGLRVVGFFEPADGGRDRTFVVYLGGRAELELGFDPPLEVGPDGAPIGIEVDLDPESWFTEVDGSVLDLSAYDFATTGEVLDFDARLPGGFIGAGSRD